MIRISARILSTALFTAAFVSVTGAAQYKDVIYDEAKVPKFFLPDPLFCANGEKVTDAKTWTGKRRP